MIKRTACALFASFVLLGTAVPASAAALPEAAVTAEEPGVERIEETTWVFRRTPEGKCQKRLWSITYGVWRSEWEDCDKGA